MAHSLSAIQARRDLLTLLGKLRIRSASDILNDLQVGFGNGSDGDLTISSGRHVLSRNMYFRKLVVCGTGTLETNGFRIHTLQSLDLTNTGSITINGMYPDEEA